MDWMMIHEDCRVFATRSAFKKLIGVGIIVGIILFNDFIIRITPCSLLWGSIALLALSWSAYRDYTTYPIALKVKLKSVYFPGNQPKLIKPRVKAKVISAYRVNRDGSRNWLSNKKGIQDFTVDTMLMYSAKPINNKYWLIALSSNAIIGILDCK